MGDQRGARPAGRAAAAAAALVTSLLLISGRGASATEFHCDERAQSCRPGPCDSCSTDVIYQSATECELRCSQADSDMQSAWVCVLPPEQGPCTDGSDRRWHFDLKVGECRDFLYGGCLGNANNFRTKSECRRGCEYRIGEIMPMLNFTHVSNTQQNRCTLPQPNTGCSVETETDGQPRFFYDQLSDLCRPFEWFGCEPDGNVFTSQLACQIQCASIVPLFPVHPPQLPSRSSLNRAAAERVHQAMPKDEDHDPCLLPADPGHCGASSSRLYYDADRRVCRQFIYGGCGGNLNNFRSLAECYGTCNSNATLTPAPAVCQAPKRVGTCSSNDMRFYYDEPTARCRAFRSSGCDSSKNNFVTLAACVSKCRPEPEDMPEPELESHALAGLEMRGRSIEGSPLRDTCSMTPAAGPCDSEIPRWHYDPFIGRCRKFLYGGCEGNSNNFASRRACEDSCGRRRPDPRTDQCSGPPKEKNSLSCTAKLQRYAFSKATGRCERLIFDGCGATLNNYRTVFECESACLDRPAEQPAERVCRLQPDPGHCDGQIDRFYFEPSSGRCRRLIYQGCRGNANNFRTMRECMNVCRDVGPVSPEPDQAIDCSAPPVNPNSRSCSESIERYYYSVPEGRCVRLLYGGCGATDNNFATMRECDRSCPPGSVNRTEVCLARPAEAGNCLGSLRRYTYDPETGTCSRFEYTGCGGNDNNFSSRRDCLDLCRGITKEDSNENMCTMSMDAGPCSGRVPRYYYDASTGRCKRFTYGGCDGNANNFIRMSECEERCGGVEPTTQPPMPSDVCQQHSLSGPCVSSILRYYFDEFASRCEQFIYSGCGGNDNNFETRAECERSCPSGTISPTTEATDTSTEPADDLCSMPPEVGPCFASMPRFYYDPVRRQCRSFRYGGCSGNANNFVTLPECNRRCMERADRPARCLAPGANACRDEPRREQRAVRSFYFDERSHRCMARAGGDCGARNSFISAAACRDECATPSSARAVCSMPAEKGNCADRQRRWAYDQRAGRCQPFEYGGCGGNKNNFATLRECLSSCRGMALSDAEDVPETCLEPPAEDDFCEPQLPSRRLWTFNAETLRCEPFQSYGCELGRNVHSSQSQCERFCQTERPTPPPEELSCDVEPRRISDCTPGEGRTIYFYVRNRDTCLSLTDRGCLSGSNKYPTREACMRRCSRDGGGGDSGEEGDKDSSVCRLPVQPGSSCKARKRRWAYSNGRCQQFFYSGCDGNGNNFETEQECRALCGGSSEPTDGPPKYCLQPPRRRLGCRPDDRTELRYYFNREGGNCDAFHYEGCHSGGNMFTSRRACMADCMPKDSGEENSGDARPQFCNAGPERLANCRPGRRQTKYYFSRSADRCLSMQSVGCERTTRNLFDTLAACENVCDPRDTENPDEGSLPSFCRVAPEVIRRCRDRQRRTMYAFSAADGRCRQFITYGCDRGRNMFTTMRECEQRCPGASSEKEDTPVCSLLPDAGRCSRFETRWYRDPTSGTCETFQYGGCGGNDNNFPSREACLERCDTGHQADNAICNQPPESGDRPCQREEQRYYWDTRSGVCRSYRYSGCGATENNFFSLRDCTDTCRKRDQGKLQPAVPERCLEKPERKPTDAGGCGVQNKRYTYSSNRGFCIPFTYTGCEETDNNFMTRSECRETCQHKDQCLLEMDRGRRCDARRPVTRFAYDPVVGGCRRFRYAGCGGNENRFTTERACLLSCGVGAATDDQEVCLLPPVEDGGANCGDRKERYFFDSALGRCVSFTFTGCGATDNNFLSMADCEDRCPAAEEAAPSPNDRAVCTMEKMPGSCLSRVLRYFYDSEERRCRPFIYTGCDGNANNFPEFSDCTATCDSRRRSLELGEAEMLSELRLIMDKMAPADKMALESTAAADATPATTLEP